MGEPQMNDQVNESVGSGPQWIGWTLVAFILFTPFIVIKLMDGKTKQAKHNTYIHGIKLNDMNYTADNFPTDKVKAAIKDGLTDYEIIVAIFGSDWDYIHFVVNIRKTLNK